MAFFQIDSFFFAVRWLFFAGRWKLTKRLGTGIELWKLYFQIRARCALTPAFNKIAGTKKIAGKRFFWRQTLFFGGKSFFCRQMLFFAGKRFFCRQHFSSKK
jgi:hypothetical protein